MKCGAELSQPPTAGCFPWRTLLSHPESEASKSTRKESLPPDMLTTGEVLRQPYYFMIALGKTKDDDQ